MSPLRARRLASRVFIAATVAASGLFVSLGSAQAAPAPTAAPHITFGVQPATRAGYDPTRAFFTYSATPGARVTDYIAFRNYAKAPVTLKTYAGDAFNTPSGAYDIISRGKKSRDLGAWIKLDRSSVTVPGQSFVIVPFSIALPPNVSPGDHSAGIVASIVTQTLTSKGSRVNVEERVGARVYVRVSGPLRPQLTVRALKTVFNGPLSPVGTGSAIVTYEVANTGNVRLSAAQRVTASALIGGTRHAVAMPRIPELLPGNSAIESTNIEGVWPGLRVKASVVLVPASDPTSPVPNLVQVRKSTSTWGIPWTLVGLIALLGASWWAIRWLRRRRRNAQLTPSTAARRRELVTTGGRPRAVLLDDPEPVDLRDRQPSEVDLREPQSGPIELPREGDVPDNSRPGDNPPSANPTRN